MANTTTLPGSTRDRVLAAAYAAKIPTNLEGLPGVGKTAILNAIAGKWGFHMETLILSIHEAEDISGLPFISPTTPLPSGRKAEIPSTQHTVPSWAIRLSHVPAGALFLDEFSTAEPRVSKAALRVVNERYVGEHQLPDTTWMLAAMNPPECAVDGTELAPPMANRFLHLKWEASASAWLDGAASGFKDYQIESVNALTGNPDEATQARMAGAVVGYIRVNPSRLNPGVPDDPDKSSRGWASSRSWSNLIAVMKFIRPDDHAAVQMVAKGLIGEGEGTAFYTWFKAAGLYDPMDVLAGRVKVNWSKDRPDVLYALCEAMVVIAKNNGTKETWEKAVAVLDEAIHARKRDVVIPAITKMLAIQPLSALLPRSVVDGLADVVPGLASVKTSTPKAAAVVAPAVAGDDVF